MLNVNLSNPVEIRNIGIKALQEALGPVGMVKFMQQSAMGRILEAFAGDELHVIPSKEIKLNSEEKELLNELLDAIADENCCYAQSKFIRGYRLGALMTMEVMSEQETFFGRDRSE